MRYVIKQKFNKVVNKNARAKDSNTEHNIEWHYADLVRPILRKQQRAVVGDGQGVFTQRKVGFTVKIDLMETPELNEVLLCGSCSRGVALRLD